MVRASTCPICHKPFDPTLDSAQLARLAPFCSDRCRQVDLMRWFDGKYAIVEQLPEDVARELAAEDGPTIPAE